MSKSIFPEGLPIEQHGSYLEQQAQLFHEQFGWSVTDESAAAKLAAQAIAKANKEK